MALTKQQQIQIKEYLINKIRAKLKNYSPETNHMPFHHRLLGKDRMALFSFIQSINTTLGISIFEYVGKIIASKKSKQAITQYSKFEGYISEKAVLTIDNILQELKNVSRKPDQKKEAQEILRVCRKGNLRKKQKKRVDLFVETNEGVEYYFELKTAKPNINEFIGIKRKLLEWIAMRGNQDLNAKIKPVVAIPYNPYEPKPYERWTLKGLFDLRSEVLVGAEFWDFLGGKNTYQDLLKIFEETGLELYDEIDKKIKNL